MLMVPKSARAHSIKSRVVPKSAVARERVKHQILSEFSGKVGDPIEQVGYIEPGHGLRGKQRWLSSIASRAGTKRPSPESENSNGSGAQKVPKTSNYNKHVDRIAEVSEIEDKLKEKHLDKYTDVQYRACANLIKMKKYDSLLAWYPYKKFNISSVSK